MLFLLAVMSALVMIIFNYVHSYRIDAKKRPIYRAEKLKLALIEFAVVVFLLISVLGFLAVCLQSYSLEMAAADFVAACVLFMPLRWFLHDEGMNMIRGLPASYVGHESWTDDFLRIMKRRGIHPSLVRSVALLLGSTATMFLQNYFYGNIQS